MPTWPTPSLASGFSFVSDSEPIGAEEGDTWYDIDRNEAKVYDGVSWHLLTVTDHGELGNVSAGQHRSDENVEETVHDRYTDAEAQAAVHDRYTDAEAQAAVHDRYTDSEAINATDGVIDAETVDGQHANELTTPNSTQSSQSQTVTVNNFKAAQGNWVESLTAVHNAIGDVYIEITTTEQTYSATLEEDSPETFQMSGYLLDMTDGDGLQSYSKFSEAEIRPVPPHSHNI